MEVLRKPPESKFAYVLVAARRARQLMGGARPLLENPRSLKATRIAMSELEHSLLEYEMPEVPGSSDGEEKRRR